MKFIPQWSHALRLNALAQAGQEKAVRSRRRFSLFSVLEFCDSLYSPIELIKQSNLREVFDPQ